MILFEKFGQHQPLNRQAERYAKEGVPLSLSTMADAGGGRLCGAGSDARRIEAHVIAAERLHGDDTTVPVLANGKTDTGRCWVYVRDDRPFGGTDPPAAMFYYSRDRAGEHPQAPSGRTIAGYSRPTRIADTTSSTSPIEARADPGSGLLGPCPPPVLCHGGCGRECPPQGARQEGHRSRRWPLRRSAASTLCSRSNAPSMAEVPSSAERCAGRSVRHWSPI